MSLYEISDNAKHQAKGYLGITLAHSHSDSILEFLMDETQHTFFFLKNVPLHSKTHHIMIEKWVGCNNSC